MVRRMVTETGAVIVHRAYRTTIGNGRVVIHTRVDGLRTHVWTPPDGNLNDRKAHSLLAMPGNHGQGNPTAVESLRLAGLRTGTGLSRLQKRGSCKRMKLSTLHYSRPGSLTAIEVCGRIVDWTTTPNNVPPPSTERRPVVKGNKHGRNRASSSTIARPRSDYA